MSEVFKEHYRLSGEPFEIAERFHAAREEKAKAWREALTELNAIGANPRKNADLTSVRFKGDTPPKGWRIARKNKDSIDCLPHRATKIGKAWAKRLSLLPEVGPLEEVLSLAGVKIGPSPTDGSRIYFAAVSRLSLPTVQWLVSIPQVLEERTIVPAAGFDEIKESEYLAAFEDHNAAVAEQKGQPNE